MNLAELINCAQTAEVCFKEYEFGFFPNFVITDIARITGVNIRGVTKIITSDAIRHIIKTHGTEDEKKRGQKPISYSDIELIPRIVANFDQVEKGREKHGQSVVFTKNIDGVDYSVAMKYFNNGGNAKLEVRTMFAK